MLPLIRTAIAHLRAELVERLPSYMVPRRVVMVDQLPHNANGKVDRRAAADLVRIALEHS
jgi:nonribosomal peptide synthetase protein VioF